MKHSLRNLIIAVFTFPLFLAAQTQSRNGDCPGVPGACGFPFANNHNATQRVGDPAPTPQNGNGTLGVIFNMQKCGLDFTSASNRMGKRFTPVGVNQPAPFVISGIPACAVIEKAYLWAEGSGNGAAQTATVAGPFGTGNYPMAIVGTGPDKCWGYGGSYTYRADVTATIGGNGTYNISGILTNPPTSGNDMDGATLLVVWSLPTAPWAGRIVIADGAYVVNGGVANYVMPLAPAVCGATTNARAFFGVGDIQFNPTSWTANGTAVPLTWNWWNFQTVNTTVATGAASATYNVNTGGDCFNLCISGLYFRTTTCTTCPSSTALTVTPSSVPATCANCNGSASVTVAPAGSYTYSWAPAGGTGSSATGLCPGIYTVTITSACAVQTQTINVTSSGGSLALSGSQTNVLCNGSCTGTATSTVSGGTAPYTYSWSPAATNSTVGATNTASGLCAGVYTVTVTDAGGCTGTRTVTITQPPALAATQTQTNVLCNGGATGAASVVVSGGTPVYSYNWTPGNPTGDGTANVTGLTAGTWSCTITDANGCTLVRTFTITQPPALAATQSQTNVLCNGGATGAASVVVSGGTPVYSYNWTPGNPTGDGTANVTGLTAGTWSCTVTDANGCTILQTFTITQPPALAATQSQTNVLCNGAATGAASVVISGGSPTYSYNWTPGNPTGDGTANVTGLTAGSWSCTVTDANGCTILQTFTITQPTAITSTGTQTNVLCNGGLTGSATVVASGGTGPYTYLWSPSGGTGSTATGLGVGTYTVTITDASGCTSSRTFTITQPTALAATTSATPATCGNNNGSASITVSGGTGPYSYSWSPSGGTGATATGLGANSYVVIVTDASGCTLTRTVVITNAGSPTATITASTNVSCFGGSNGSATVAASAGTGPYSYNWTPGNPTGDGTVSVTGLTAGSWTCTVTDANGCIAIATVTLTAPTALTATATSSPVLCNGGTTGSATVTATGGVGPYTYNWLPSGGTGSTATGLGAAAYTVTVTDANGCTATASTTVTQPTAITSTGTQTNVLCNGGLTGSASVVASGGTGPYTYNWAPSGGTVSTATGLGAGTYTVTITDANGCTSTRSFTITQPTVLTSTTSFTQSTCGSSNGSAAVVASGGVGPYTYLWSPSGGTGATATGLAAGAYTVVYTDANGCTGTASVTVPNAGSPTATITATTNVSCFGGNNGSASVAASGGTGPYTYAWTPTGGTSATGTPLIAGAYTVTVTDANGCSTTATSTITQPPTLAATATSSPVLCFGGTTGSATVTATGGVAPYTYNWTPSGGTGSSATGLGAATYTVTVTDANGCTTTATTTVTQPTALAATATSSPVLCFGGNTGSASVTASGGTAGYTYNWAPSGGTGSSATGLIAGIYTVTVTDANGCTTTAITTVTEPTALAATTSFTQSTCGNANGAAAVVVTGGTAAYSYLWSPSGGTGATATGLAAGAYTVVYTDANGCTGTASVTVPNAGSPTATITATTNVSCFGGNNGSASVAASGGTGPYTYAWAPTGGTGTTGTPLIAGNYTVTVTDANGCSTTATATITEPPALAATATSSPVLCFGGTTGSATVTATGGVAPYTYNWVPSGGTGSSATGLGAATYTVTVTDANGCTTTATTTVTQPTALAATATSSPVLCFGGNTGSASVTASGGTAGYTYNWAPSGGTGVSATGLTAGVYTVTVTDANGCTTTASTTVTQPIALTATTSFTQSTCNAANGAAFVVCGGGSPLYTYLWSPSGGTTASANGLVAGVYTCLITDANGCTLTASVTVPNANSPLVTIIATDSVSCFGGNDGFAAASSTGGTTPYSYLWSNADADTLAGNLTAGSYTVTVTDANGCTSSTAVNIGEPTLLTATASSTDVLCFGGNTGTGASTATGGTGSYTYNWSPSGGTGATATGLITGTYTLTVTDVNGCTAAATTTVNEPPALTITATFTPVSCFGGADGTATGTATGGLGAYTYNWSPSGGTGATASALTIGQYVITVTDANGCTASATTTVTEPTALTATTSSTQSTCSAANGSADVVVTGGTGAYTYLWSPGGATTSTATGLAANTYSCLITDANGCTLTATVVVQNANAPVVTIAPPTMVSCFSGNNGSALASATGGTGPYTYLWSNADGDSLAGNLTAGAYSVVVTDANGCTSTASVVVIEPTLLNVQASANPTAVCEGSPVQLTANAGGGTPAYTYVWMPGPTPGQTINITPAVTTTYTVTVADANGCTVSAPVLVTVNPMPVPALSADVTSGCAPLCVTFSDLSTLASGTITAWGWDFGDNTTATQQNPPVHCYNTPGVYTVVLTVTTSAGCTQTITMPGYISVFAMPVADFGAGPQPTTVLNPTITFTDSSTNAAAWLWSFGDILGSSSAQQNPTFSYTDVDCYQVILEVTSVGGCVDTSMQTVCIGPDVSIYVPNTFTPDENGINDVFLPVTFGIDPDQYELWIFDRWGNMIFYSDELNEGWDGRVQGNSDICQVDTYVWKIKCKDLLGKKHDLIGHVNLIK